MSHIQLRQDHRRYADYKAAEPPSRRTRIIDALLLTLHWSKKIGTITFWVILCALAALLLYAGGKSFHQAMKNTTEVRAACQTRCEAEGFLSGKTKADITGITCTCSNTKSFTLEASPP